MQGVHLRKYGVQTTINFDLFEVDGVDFRVDAVYAAGDVKIMKDEGAEANTTNSFTDEGQGYSIVLTATEMQAARIVLYFVDQTATKVWLDKSIVIETYGNASAMHEFDLDSTSPVSDVHSRLVVIEAAIDSDQALITSDTSDVLSKLTAWENAGGIVSDIQSKVVDVKAAVTAGGYTGAYVSDVHSRLVVIEAAIDSDTASAETIASDTLSLLTLVRSDTAAIEAAGGALTSDQNSKLTAIAGTTLAGGALEDMVSDAYSLLVVWTGAAGILSDIGSGVDAIQAAGGALTSDQDSKLTATATAVLAGGTLEDMVSDTYSRLLVIEAAIDSDTASAETIASDTLSLLTLVRSDTAAIEAAGGALTSDQNSKLTAVEDHASDAYSRLVVVEASIDSDQTSRTAAISNIHSRLVVVEAAIDSDQVSRTAAISDIKSELVVISDAVLAVDGAIDSDQTSRATALANIDSQVTATYTEASETHSRLVVVEAAIDSDQALDVTATSNIHSRLVVIEAAIDSDQTSRTAAISDVKSALTIAASDAALLEAADAEPTGVPAANESPLDKLAYLYMVMRNKVTVTSSKKTVYGDDDAGEWEHDLTDDGTTMTQTEANAI